MVNSLETLTNWPISFLMYLLAKELILEDYITTILVVLVAILFAVFSKRIVHLFTSRFKIDSEVINILSKLLAIFALCLGSFYALSNLGVRIGPILGTVGIGGIALAFALQNLVLNLLGSVLIHSRRPFRTGDQIEFTEHEGTVVDINTRTVVLLTYGGNLVHIPNAKIMDEPFVNLTKEQSRRSSLDILVAYGTDLQLAASVAIEAIRSTGSRFVLYNRGLLEYIL